MSARFIKSGANDFLYKPFVTEEFYCRVAENVRSLEQQRTLVELTQKDFLSGLCNRRHFFTLGTKLFANAKREHLSFCIAMVDIDHFKRVNDTYGHDAGDAVIRGVSAALAGRFREGDLVARLGGEEFGVLAVNMEPGEMHRVFDEVRQTIAAVSHRYGGEELRVTVSVGVCRAPADSLEQTLQRADECLYEAKRSGRDRVVCR